MIQVWGALLLIAALGGVGLLMADNLSRQAAQWEELEYGLNVLLKEITYGHTRLPQALGIAGRQTSGPAGRVLAAAGGALATLDLNPHQAFEQALAREKGLEAREAAGQVLLRLAGQLGVSGAEEQERFLKLALEEIRLYRDRARDRASSQGKIYRWGGFLLGGILALLLI